MNDSFSEMFSTSIQQPNDVGWKRAEIIRLQMLHKGRKYANSFTIWNWSSHCCFFGDSGANEWISLREKCLEPWAIGRSEAGKEATIFTCISLSGFKFDLAVLYAWLEKSQAYTPAFVTFTCILPFSDREKLSLGIQFCLPCPDQACSIFMQ